MQNSLASLISLLKINLIQKKLIVKCPYSKLNINILKILYMEGYIKGFKINSKTYQIYIYLKINNNRVMFKDIVYFPANNKNNFFSYENLLLTFGLKNFAIISTNVVY